MEGTSCLEPLEQSILQASWIARPCNGVIKQKSEWKPVITPASRYTLDSRPMEGITYLERPALGGVPGQWTYGGGAVSGTTGAVGS